jgi:hypothetical protein
MDSKIQAIYGVEPHREGEYPETYTVGKIITRIQAREQNLGTYGIQWFDVYHGDVIKVSMNAAYVASVSYFPPKEGE